MWHGGDHFGGFGDGSAVLGGDAQREDFLDRIRFFAEECDSMQVITTANFLQHNVRVMIMDE